MDKPKAKSGNIVRIAASADEGLTKEQVNERIASGAYNKESSVKTKSYGRILRDNTFTLFNLINLVLAAAVFYVQSYKNLLFMVIILINIAIGTIQEIRAKRTIDKLAIISAKKAKAVREGKIDEVSVNDIVLDDILELSQGNQVPTDCILIDGSCEVNESLLTGEADAIFKAEGDQLMSGSFVVSGKCRVRANRVGKDNYASEIFSGAKYVKKVNSEIMHTLNKIIQIISIAIVPLGGILFWRQLTVDGGVSLSEAVVNTTAGLIGMIPEGLVLLTSTVLAVGIIRLSKYKVLVQELYSIETLARVDVLCLDKTGTITEGCMEVYDVIPADDYAKEDFENILAEIASSSQDDNPTINAIKEKYNNKSTFAVKDVIPFSSDKKWSGVSFENEGTFVMGAEEFVLKENSDSVKYLLSQVENGYRVIVVAHSENNFDNRELPKGLKPVGIVIIKDKIRKDAKATLDYFAKQGVDLKIISGDNVNTVSAIAKAAGLKNYDKFVDATTLKTCDDIKAAAGKYSVFGRVTPSQKYDIVKSLKEAGHTVAMTGDGVNDVLALKEADCSVAMASGSEAARSVSQLVLLDSNFASMPKVVAEGRRSINNIQRSASLFLVKTIFSTLMSLMFVFVPAQYPFEPIQMTLINIFTIGIPSFILALEPNSDRIRGKFFINVLSKAVPGGLTVTLTMIFVVLLDYIFALTSDQYSTIAVIATSFIGLMVLFKISLPFNRIRSALFVLMTAGIVFSVLFLKNIFNLSVIDLKMLIISLIPIAISFGIYVFLNFLMDKILNRHIERINRKFSANFVKK